MTKTATVAKPKKPRGRPRTVKADIQIAQPAEQPRQPAPKPARKLGTLLIELRMTGGKHPDSGLVSPRHRYQLLLDGDLVVEDTGAPIRAAAKALMKRGHGAEQLFALRDLTQQCVRFVGSIQGALR